MSKPITIPNVFQTLPGPLPLANLDQDFTTLANAINDVATYSNYFVDSSGAANVITVTTPTALAFSLTAGVQLQIKLANTNTATGVTVNVNGGGVQTLLNADGTAPAVGQLVAAQILPMIYDGTAWRLSGPQSKSYATGSIAPFVATGAGNVSLPAPSSGTGLSLGGSTTIANGLQVTNSGVAGFAGQGVELFFSAGTGGLQAYDRNAVAYLPLTVRGLSTTFTYGSTAASAITISSTGNVAFPAPASGNTVSISTLTTNIPLTLDAPVAGQSAVLFTITTASEAIIGVGGTAGNLITGSGANDLNIRTNGTSINFSTNSGASVQAKFDATGLLNLANGAGSISPVYAGIPQVGIGGARTTVLSDANKHIYQQAAGTITIAAQASVNYPVGTAITFVNYSGGPMAIAINGGDNLNWAQGGALGTRTLANYGVATALKVANTSWNISGTGLS